MRKESPGVKRPSEILETPSASFAAANPRASLRGLSRPCMYAGQANRVHSRGSDRPLRRRPPPRLPGLRPEVTRTWRLWFHRPDRIACDSSSMQSAIGLYATGLIRARRRSWASRREAATATTARVRWFEERRPHAELDSQSPDNVAAACARSLAPPTQDAYENGLHQNPNATVHTTQDAYMAAPRRQGTTLETTPLGTRRPRS